ncbi:MAG: hypothetical protein HKN14_01035 [Marinicaulis sp.]|nr:hypothetical protein [Marinicaulis sp.]
MERLTLPKLHERVSGTDYNSNDGDFEAFAALVNNFLNSSTGLENSTTAAALQVIIWEIIEDGATSFDLEVGAFTMNTESVRDVANSFWMAIANGDFTKSSFDVFAARGTQDLITFDTPLPGALPMLLTGFAGFSYRVVGKRTKPLRSNDRANHL